ncbi:MAG: hypothetical protein AAF429_05150 [Pseudomonadota bacterium]
MTFTEIINSDAMEFLKFLLLIITPLVLTLNFRRTVSATRLQFLHDLTERHMEHMLKTIDNPNLNAVWNPFTATKLKSLRTAQSKKPFGAWHKMNDKERACYRFVRAALEHIEQASDAHDNKWMPREAWKKWEERIKAWKTSPYWEFIETDAWPFLNTKFKTKIEKL